VRILGGMSRYTYDNKDIIYALATSWGTSPIAVIRISGEGCIATLATSFSKPKALNEAKSHTVVHGLLKNIQSGEKVDEVLITLFKEGRGYTGEESCEIACHGSPVGIEAIFKLLNTLKMRSALPGEFTFRAFMNGKIDLTQAEAVMEIVDSQSDVAHALALGRLEGNLFSLIEEIKMSILDAVSVIELQLDYAEDEIIDETDFPTLLLEEAKRLIDELLETYSVGKLYRDGARVVIAGATNAGKSTLFNLLLKEERSIVSEIHGTTRDFIESKTTLDGIPIQLFDTAGLRESSDFIELEGIKRSRSLIEQADLVLLLIDRSQQLDELTADEKELVEDRRCIVIYNKSDLSSAEIPQNSFALSAKKGEGFAPLRDEMIKRLRKDGKKVKTQAIVIESERQMNELKRASEALGEALKMAQANVALDIIAVELNEALYALGTLTGELSSTDVLDNIFSNFCVGK
jgi:tRNA modification GTPase